MNRKRTAAVRARGRSYTAGWRARRDAGRALLKIDVDRERTIALLEQAGALRPPAGAFAGYEFPWPEVQHAAAAFWETLLVASDRDVV